MEHFIEKLINLILYFIIITHGLIKQVVFFTVTLFYKVIYSLFLIYNSIEITLNAWAISLTTYSFLQFSYLYNFLNELYLDVFSFDHRIINTCFMLLFVVAVTVSNALNFNKVLTENLFSFLFVICYIYIISLISSVIFLILLHFKNISCDIWYIFIKDYRNSLGYKLLTLIIIIYLLHYYFANKNIKKSYLLYFFILLFGWFANYFVYQNFEITSSSNIDPSIDLLISLCLNWFLYDFLYYLVDKTDPEVIKTYRKWNKWLDSLASNVFIEKLPLRSFLIALFFINYILFILMGLI